MKILFLDLGMGAAGDMLAAALYELIDDKEDFIKEINAAGIPGAEIKAEDAYRCAIRGTRMRVLINGCGEGSPDAGYEHSHDSREHCHEDSCEGHSLSNEHTRTGHDRSRPDAGKSSGSVHSHEDPGLSGGEGRSSGFIYENSGHGHNHPHRSMADIEALTDALNVSAKVKADVKEVYKIIAQAESRAHGREVSEIHFHEAGAMDAIADITAVCMLMERLAPDKVIASPVRTGYGHVHAAHGIIPVPAPATTNILEDFPSYEGDIEAELCTPTGAALVKYFANETGRMGVMYSKKTGYGMGSKELERCNALRAVIGNSTPAALCGAPPKNAPAAGFKAPEKGFFDEASFGQTPESSFEDAQKQPDGEKKGAPSCSEEELKDKVFELSFTVDDMTGEEVAFACEKIFEAGALDVYTQSVYMKKNRPGMVVDILAKEEFRDRIVSAVFKHTTTLGIREAFCERYILKRENEVIESSFGTVRKKVSRGWGACTEKFEYDDLCAIARDAGMSLGEIKHLLKNLSMPGE